MKTELTTQTQLSVSKVVKEDTLGDKKSTNKMNIILFQLNVWNFEAFLQK